MLEKTTYLEVNNDSGDQHAEALEEVAQHVDEGGAHVDVLRLLVLVVVRRRALRVRVRALFLLRGEKPLNALLQAFTVHTVTMIKIWMEQRNIWNAKTRKWIA